MYTYNSYLQLIETLLKNHGLLSISGPSGSGKSTLAQIITGNFITKNLKLEESAIWIQASEYFSSKRLETLFQQEPLRLHYLKNNIYIIPGKNTCSNFIGLKQVLNKFIHEDIILPPGLKFIVIDNISHHIRYEISRIENIKERNILIDDFFNSLLSPLIMRCHRERIFLVLIHEISYVPNLKQEKPFLHKLYNRLKSIEIVLTKDLISKRKSMKIFENSEVPRATIKYELCNTGIIFC